MIMLLPNIPLELHLATTWQYPNIVVVRFTRGISARHLQKKNSIVNPILCFSELGHDGISVVRFLLK